MDAFEIKQVGDKAVLEARDMTRGDTCFYRVQTRCGILQTAVNASSYGQALNLKVNSSNTDKVHVSFIEFTENAFLMAEEWTNPLLGGGPMEGHPMRAETFNYPKNNDISDAERIVTQGRINLDTKTWGYKYWGSYEQGVKKALSETTQSCLPRNTYFFVMVQGTDARINITMELESTNLLYIR